MGKSHLLTVSLLHRDRSNLLFRSSGKKSKLNFWLNLGLLVSLKTFVLQKVRSCASGVREIWRGGNGKFVTAKIFPKNGENVKAVYFDPINVNFDFDLFV